MLAFLLKFSVNIFFVVVSFVNASNLPNLEDQYLSKFHSLNLSNDVQSNDIVDPIQDIKIKLIGSIDSIKKSLSDPCMTQDVYNTVGEELDLLIQCWNSDNNSDITIKYSYTVDCIQTLLQEFLHKFNNGDNSLSSFDSYSTKIYSLEEPITTILEYINRYKNFLQTLTNIFDQLFWLVPGLIIYELDPIYIYEYIKMKSRYSDIINKNRTDQEHSYNLYPKIEITDEFFREYFKSKFSLYLKKSEKVSDLSDMCMKFFKKLYLAQDSDFLSLIAAINQNCKLHICINFK